MIIVLCEEREIFLKNQENLIWTGVDHFKVKLCKFYTFLFFYCTHVNALILFIERPINITRLQKS